MSIAVIHRPIKHLTVVAFAAALTLTFMGAALAAPPSQTEATDTTDTTEGDEVSRKGYFGTIGAVGDGVFSIDTRQGGSVRVQTSDETKYRAPGVEAPGFDDLTVGARVAVVVLDDGESLTALHVMLVPGQPQRRHRVLTVREIFEGTLIAEDADGNEVTVELGRELAPELVGEVITFIGERSAQSNRFKANAEVKIRQVVDRLERHAERLRSAVDEDAVAATRAEKVRALEAIQDRIATTAERHLDRLASVRDRLPAQGKVRIEAVLETARERYSARVDALGERAGEVRARLALHSVTGSVTAVDIRAGTLTIQPVDGRSVTLHITDETKFHGVEALEGIAAGSRATARFNAASLAAAEVRAMPAEQLTPEVRTRQRADVRGGRP
ncbi:MAG: hypothetical protein WD645_03215 [Dehalococcoidia bacterium]